MEHDSQLAQVASKPLAPQDFAELHLRFLQQHGAATHTVFVDSTVPDWQSVARRLHSDIAKIVTGVVPLGDGRLAITCPFGLPAALGTMPIRVTRLEPVTLSDEVFVEISEKGPEPTGLAAEFERISDRLDGIDFAMAELAQAYSGTGDLTGAEVDETLLALLAELSALRDVILRISRQSVADTELAKQLADTVSDLKALAEAGPGEVAINGGAPRGVARLFSTLVDTIERLEETISRFEQQGADQGDALDGERTAASMLAEIIVAQDLIAERLEALEDLRTRKAEDASAEPKYLLKLRQAMDAGAVAAQDVPFRAGARGA